MLGATCSDDRASDVGAATGEGLYARRVLEARSIEPRHDRPIHPTQRACHLPRAGWISVLLLEWLRKLCNHPAQGLTAADVFGPSYLPSVPAGPGPSQNQNPSL